MKLIYNVLLSPISLLYHFQKRKMIYNPLLVQLLNIHKISAENNARVILVMGYSLFQAGPRSAIGREPDS